MKISIITVCYNSAKTIGCTLRSVRQQTFGEIEYIVIDGGSSDSTLEVLSEEGPHVSILISEKDGGIYDAMNKGIEYSTGEIVGFINSDDFYASSDVISKVASVFDDPNVDACYGDLCYVSQVDTSTVVRYWQSSRFNSTDFESGWCPPHPTFFVRRELYERYGGFDLSYKIAADFELMVRFLGIYQIRSEYIPDVLVKMRMGGTTNRSFTNIIKQNKEILLALNSHGFRSSIFKLIINKFFSRGRQFFFRPKKVFD